MTRGHKIRQYLPQLSFKLVSSPGSLRDLKHNNKLVSYSQVLAPFTSTTSAAIMASELVVETCIENYKHSFREDLLSGKVAFITGGGSGICFTIAEILMRHGCRTAIVGRKMERLQRSSETLTGATGVKCLPVQADVRKPQEVLAGFDKCLQEFGRADIIINGAAGNFLCALEDLSFNGFKTVIEIDTLGTYNVSKVAFDKYLKDHGGVIINISATLHHRGTILQTHLGVAKAGIETLAKHQAVEWGPKGVRVVNVAPGPVESTEGLRRLGAGMSNEDIGDIMPVGRVGTRQEMGEICLFLASDMAGQITGSTVIADGGAWMVSGHEKQRMSMYRQFKSKM
ncbi:peroxisomal 2,4-dienoyl-CoA reductase [Elysia marginata]|uniref:Peroxisomal 2,4-dienoyl-CoA reductase [(3E)-enoyl-CoA-producing] n=1 Tax=Elysia marginata TaxID=1093978 RepID=A0AAV4IES5_9GAST|nr:peroxisomal 2,4-dienoyl-CoA reductase [Elysia marginata]